MTGPASPDPSPQSPSTAHLRAMRVLVIVLTAVIISGAAGLLSFADGASIPRAILTAGAAFAGATALLLGIDHYAQGN